MNWEFIAIWFLVAVIIIYVLTHIRWAIEKLKKELDEW